MKGLIWASMVAALAALLAVGGPVGSARADGCYIPTQNVAISSDQQALIIQVHGSTSLTLSTAYTGSGDDFAWIIPTPVPPREEDLKEFEEIGPRALQIVEQTSAPKVRPERASPGPSCHRVVYTEASKAPADVTIEISRVTLKDYDITVLASTGADSLLEWLDRNGFPLPVKARTTLGDYIDEGWFFVAVKLTPGERREYQAEFLPPLTIRLETDEMIFPMRVSAISSVGEVRLSLFTIAESTMSSSNYPTRDLEYKAEIGPNTDPQAYVRDAIKKTTHHRDVGLARVYAAPFNNLESGLFEEIHGQKFSEGVTYHLTRLETILTPVEMTQDIDLKLDPQPTQFYVHLIAAADQAERWAAIPALAPIALVIGGVWAGARSLRRRVNGQR